MSDTAREEIKKTVQRLCKSELENDIFSNIDKRYIILGTLSANTELLMVDAWSIMNEIMEEVE